MKKNILYLLMAAFLVVGLSSCDEEEPEPEKTNYYMLDEMEYSIGTDMFWYQSGMGGDPYIRLITDVDGQENPDLLKLYPNKGLNALEGTYTWEAKPAMGSAPEGTYDMGYTAGYAGMSYDWTAIGKTGSGELEISMTDEDGIYKVTGTFILSVGSYDFTTGEFTETGTKTMELHYTGAITDL